VQLVLIILVLAVAAGFLAHGSLRPFERLTLRWWGLAVAGLALQAVPLPHASGRGVVTAALVASYVLLIAFVWRNRWLPAAPLMLIGLSLNLLVVAPNAGMPVSANAVRIAGGTSTEVPLRGTGPDKHHLMSDRDVLRPLGDVIPGPPPLGVVLSIGDLFLYAGVASFVVLVMLGRFDGGRRASPRWLQGYRGKHLPRKGHLPKKTQARRYRPSAPAAAAPPGSGP
jgi:Family of unknown function (DUF5317)